MWYRHVNFVHGSYDCPINLPVSIQTPYLQHSVNRQVPLSHLVKRLILWFCQIEAEFIFRSNSYHQRCLATTSKTLIWKKTQSKHERRTLFRSPFKYLLCERCLPLWATCCPCLVWIYWIPHVLFFPPVSVNILLINDTVRIYTSIASFINQILPCFPNFNYPQQLLTSNSMHSNVSF